LVVWCIYDPGLVRRVSQSMSHKVDLSWKAPNSAHRISGYHVYRAKAGDSSYQLLNSTLVTQTKFMDITVRGGQSYDYFVRSVDATGAESLPSNKIRVTVPWIPDLLRPFRAGRK
jgi:fibronectin type 3 domain-containing protein